MTNTVELDWAEMFDAACAGAQRQIPNVLRGRKDAHGISEDVGWQAHIEGALAEKAFAKFAGIYWHGKGKLRAPDVGEVDIRSTRHTNGRLLVHKDDPDDRRFWLVVGQNGRYRVAGWLWGREAKQDRFWGEPSPGRPAFCVPQSELHEPVWPPTATPA